MRFFTNSFVLLAAVLVLSSLAGCATQTVTARGSDTAVRAEARRISNTGPLAERGSVGNDAPVAHVHSVTTL